MDHVALLGRPASSGVHFSPTAWWSGSLVAGAIGAGVILRNISGGAADISIVPGAPDAAVPFDPAIFTVSVVGGTVTWINKDTMSHTVTSDTGLFDSGILSTGATWSHTFTTPGMYPYHCTPHPQMTGTIVVQ